MQGLSKYHITNKYNKRTIPFIFQRDLPWQVSSALLLEQSPLVPLATRWEAEAHLFQIGTKQETVKNEDVISLFRPKEGETVGYEVRIFKISFIFCA